MRRAASKKREKKNSVKKMSAKVRINCLTTQLNKVRQITGFYLSREHSLDVQSVVRRNRKYHICNTDHELV